MRGKQKERERKKRMGDEKKHFSFRLFSFLSFFLINEDRKEREGGGSFW